MILIEAEFYAAAVSPQVSTDVLGQLMIFADVPYRAIIKKFCTCYIFIETAVALNDRGTAVLLLYPVGISAKSFGDLTPMATAEIKASRPVCPEPSLFFSKSLSS